MIARGFKSVLWVGAVGSAALSCYMVSLRVATERADLARVEGQIVDAKRDIRTLETELGTRGRLAQLEDWNTNVLALSAPSSGQFVKDAYTLARLQTHEPTVEERTGAMRMASLETGQAAPAKTQPAPRPRASAEQDSPPAPKAAPEAAAPLPRVVEAVAAAPASRQTTLVRRASYTLSVADDAPATEAAAKPDKPRTSTTAKPATPKKVKVAVKTDSDEPTAPETHEARRAERTAAADKPETKRSGKAAHAAPKLARADADHVQTSGHRGGAQ